MMAQARVQDSKACSRGRRREQAARTGHTSRMTGRFHGAVTGEYAHTRGQTLSIRSRDGLPGWRRCTTIIAAVVFSTVTDSRIQPC
jgi:hypothetical protein